jgi:acetylornithine aminotransferase/acetylornithine/N-succinyldiaminopimelate aminotransferase
MTKLESLQAAEKKLVMQTYARSPYLFVSGEGVHLRDENGTDYLDLLSGIGVTALGYAHPAVTAAIAQQSTKLLHTSNLFFHEGTADLAMRLTELSGLDRIFLCNSGTEAWEAALKLARAHAELLRAEGKHIGTRILALEHSFHGRTIGSVATTHKLAYRGPFAPVMPGVDFVRFNDLEDLRVKFTDEICAICIEPVQGEGGIHPISKEFFAEARRLCDQTGALLLADEIQCGFGRTGKWFAYQHYGIQPDITTIAKPMANGLPIGAMLATDEASRAFTPGMHGTTFGGGPLACAVATAVIDTIKQTNLLAHVEEVGQYFREALTHLAKKHEIIQEVRGLGLMIGVEIESTELATQIAATMLTDQHIILNRTSDTVLRFLPPYILTREHVDQAITALDATMSTLTTLAGTPAGDHAHG